MQWKVITLVTSKGGAGKTTGARSLAGYWFALGHKPILIDADPEARLAKRYDPTGKLAGLSIMAEPEERVGELIEELRAKYAPVIVDTAGFRNRTTIAALVATDLALIPLKPSGDDADAAVDTLALIREINETPERAGRPIRAAMMMTMGIRGTAISRHVREQLVAGGYPLLKAEMFHRVAYSETALDGLSPSITDPDGAAARDIAAVANEIMSLENHQFMNKESAV